MSQRNRNAVQQPHPPPPPTGRTTREMFHTLWAPGDMENYVKLAVQFHNQNNPEQRHVDLKAVNNNLNSTLMCTLVSSLLKELDDSFDPEPQTSTLPEFERLGLTNGPYVYDSTIEHIFVECSKYFNMEDDTLHIGLFWNPEKNVKRAKHVIAWLVAYCIFVDNFGVDTFQTRYEEMTQEIEKKAQLYNEIEEIKTNIAQSIVEGQERENSLPQIEKELKEVEMKIHGAHNELNKLEGVAAREKDNYDAKAAELRSLEDKLKDMEREKVDLQDQLVHSATDIMQSHTYEKNKVKQANALRNQIGQELQSLSLDEQRTIQLMEKMKISLESFESLMVFVNKAGEAIDSLNKSSHGLLNKCKERAELQQEIVNFRNEMAKFKIEVEQRNQEVAANLRTLKEETKRIEEEQESVSFANQELLGQIHELEDEVRSKQSQIQNCVAKMQEYERFYQYQKEYNIPEDDPIPSMLEIYNIKKSHDPSK